MNTARTALAEDNPADVYSVEMALKENRVSYELKRFEDGEEAVPLLVRR